MLHKYRVELGPRFSLSQLTVCGEYYEPKRGENVSFPESGSDTGRVLSIVKNMSVHFSQLVISMGAAARQDGEGLRSGKEEGVKNINSNQAE